jgi:four helix bundle protein
MEESAGYKKLIVWQKADELTLLVYKETQVFPKSELFALTSQLRRASLSVPTNIVEGYARNSKPEFKRFVVIALGSLAEVKYLLSVAFRLHYLSNKQYSDIVLLTESVGQLLWKFCKSL